MSSIFFDDLEAVKIAVNMERNGLRFYAEAARKVRDPNVRRILEELGTDELRHIALFEKLEQSLLQEPRNTNDPEAEELDTYVQRLVETHVFADAGTASRLLAETDSDIAALGLGMRAERDAILFYQEMANFTDSKAAQEAFRTIIDEERQHLVALAARSEACEKLRG